MSWEKEGWGVAVDFEDGFSVAYPVRSQKAACEHLEKVKNDPDFALRVRWGKHEN